MTLFVADIDIRSVLAVAERGACGYVLEEGGAKGLMVDLLSRRRAERLSGWGVLGHYCTFSVGSPSGVAIDDGLGGCNTAKPTPVRIQYLMWQ